MATSLPTLFLIGDANLVAEFGGICHAAGYKVVFKVNRGETTTTFPKHLKKVSAIPQNVHMAIELTLDKGTKRKNLLSIEKSLRASSVIMSSSVTVSATEQASWLRDPSRLIGFGAMPTLVSQELLELAPGIYTDQSIVLRATDFAKHLGKEVAVVQDRVGMVMPRILCMLINEAFFALTENIAAPKDIDTAMRLGTNYPHGLIEWSDRIGLQNVCAVLQAIYEDLAEDRYRIAPLLKQMATGRSWWRT